MKLIWFLAIVIATAFANDTPALKELKAGNLQFSANTYKEVAKENVGKNFLVCPLSVQVVLALVEAGAAGRTAQQLITGLNLPDTEEKIHEAFKSISPGLNVDDPYTLSSANKIYLKKGYKIKSDFKNVATQVFNAEITEIEFTEKIAAAAQINKWVLEKTHNKINNLISPDDLDEFTRAVLINALYFKGQWVHEFENENTSEKSFKVSSTKETQVKMMEQTNRFNYYEDPSLNAKFLEMHYNGGSVSMVIVLPNDIDGLSALEANIDKVLVTPNFKFEKVHVQIPHVHIEQKIDFIGILKKFGVNDAFDTNADFSRLNGNKEPLVISKIVQKTFIDVEEKGTTAAAATAVVIAVPVSAIFDLPTPIMEFNACHPFLIILKSREGILFVGRFVDPGNF